MKRTLLTLLFYAITICLFADPVSQEQASKIAKNFYSQVAPNKNLADIKLSLAFAEKSMDVSRVRGNNTEETDIFYIFNVNQNDGFVIITADNDVVPVLGYSSSGSYSPGNIPPALRKLLENYKKEIIYVLLNNLKADNEIQGKWSRLENGESLNSAKNFTSVNPLLTTTWNQSPYYNALCPYDYSYNELTVTGCVATAMAQIMKYWNYPSQGIGFHSYVCPNYGTQTANFA
ncbi:MAG: C10 family peptidase, partial [Bacteroidales bacterium]